MSQTIRYLLCLCATLLLVPQSLFAQRDLKDIPPPDPELERETFIVPEGFEVNLYAADPMLAKPIQMNFDELGRLWIASSEIYPQIKPGEQADDKILILEDTDNDGVAENTTIFADGLLIPTGVIPGDGGAYVANSTELLHLTDTDGDGKADRTRVVLSGFGTEDTHHILHTLRWGPEGLLYFNQSIYIHSHLETPHGVKRLDAGGIWQFRPETMELDIHMRGLVNSWGHHFDDYGQSFATDGAGGEGINYIVPGAYYFTAVGSNRIIRGLNPGSPKHCGLEIVRSSHLPDDWQGSMLTNDFRGHRVCRFQVSDDGSGFASREQEEVIKSNHVAFRPIDVKVGPDGAIYIADWYNPIIQHGEVDFRDPRRDHTHGRIWRVVNKNKPLLEKPKLAEADNTELLNSLKSPEEFTRTHAMRMLRERHLDTGILPSLETWFQNLDANDPGFENHRLQGLWAYQALNIPAPEVLEAMLKSKDDRVRAAAVRVIGHWFPHLEHEFDLLSAAVTDDSPRVRLEAVRVLGKIADPRSLEIALRALDREMDSFLDYALWLTCRELRPVWLPELEAGRLAVGTNPAHLIFAFKSLDQNASVAPLVRLLNENKLGPEQTSQIERAIADLGQPPDVKVLFDRLISEQATAAQQLSLLSALSAAANRNVVPPGDLNPAGKLLHAENPEVVVSACRTIGLWKLATQSDALATLAKDNAAPPAVRDSAIYALAEIGGEIQPLYAALTKEDQPVEVRRSAIVAFSDKLPRRAAKDAIALWNAPGGDKQIDPVLSALLQRQNVVAALTEELQSSKLPADTAKLALRVVNSSGRKFDDLVAGFSKAGDIKAGAVVLTKEQMDRMVGLVREQGDPARGEIIFRRNDLACFKCHAIGGAGGKVGPDLISLGAS
ncbi:MAG TPA: PVC-type heme-binding CxxCH protein, partial [Planctomycetaceae bacterium]|nr:PVC-type heme-binding CxxCH protein [Planctomycetaceae bacterium]